MSEPSIILCPGQGAQVVGMARAWCDRSDQARLVFTEADAILGGSLGAPLAQLCFDGPVERLNQTDVSQPAIYVTSIACYRALGDAFFGSTAAAAGLSLGECTALHLAGVFSFADGLRLVALCGRLMQDAAEKSNGSMVALIGADEAQAHEVCERAGRGRVLVPANFNAPGQIVLSGEETACADAVKVAGDLGLRATPLAVAGAFHSELMRPAAERMGEALERVSLSPPRFPVVSNVTAKPHEADPASIRRLLVQQITSPVRWSQSCEWLGGHVRGRYHELAPGRVLAGLMRRINRETKVVNHDQPGA